ncbi:tocopherol cyclase family protein [Candidatus Lokiarchaeum ossiferum]|uniref:tocopherol cyclase family protein n=1 Tax=Candidatus Lokiarchaeum ossiferum TaxID=2951803 RepID=UPI00352E3798
MIKNHLSFLSERNLRFHNPSMFQGNLKKKQYFEGWYYKIVDESTQTIFAIIPGIALSKQTHDSHAFIQILNGSTAKYHYLSFPISEFKARKDKFDIAIGNNHFSQDFIKIDVKSQEIQVKGQLNFVNLRTLPYQRFLPGIMGIFSYLPNMECYHGIVSMNHRISGNLTINQNQVSFSDGKGYIEKDWGKSFPKKWIWMQANHFKEFDRSFMFSIAQIEYFGKTFVGFLAVLYNLGEFNRFTTYNFDQYDIVYLTSKSCKICLSSSKYYLIITATKDKSLLKTTSLMKAPQLGKMTAKCAESIKANIKLKLYRKKTVNFFEKKYELVFEDQSNCAGLELMGDTSDF